MSIASPQITAGPHRSHPATTTARTIFRWMRESVSMVRRAGGIAAAQPAHEIASVGDRDKHHRREQALQA
jgi:hypothetical protein